MGIRENPSDPAGAYGKSHGMSWDPAIGSRGVLRYTHGTPRDPTGSRKQHIDIIGTRTRTSDNYWTFGLVPAGSSMPYRGIPRRMPWARGFPRHSRRDPATSRKTLGGAPRIPRHPINALCKHLLYQVSCLRSNGVPGNAIYIFGVKRAKAHKLLGTKKKKRRK